ncbi:MAG TPA: RES domain-containing protein [Methylococcaceae bacterium]|nr:RES domain-containing protein [Methylococcaceae bacterium]
MPVCWRIVTPRFAATAFSGEGARLYGGRWNPKGVPMIYTAESRALAVLEILVQDEPLRARYMLIPARIPDELVLERIAAEELPAHWQSTGPKEELQRRGAAWARGGASAVLAVPSAVIPDETNYLLNPAHPDFSRIAIGDARELVTDLRLLGRKPEQ